MNYIYKLCILLSLLTDPHEMAKMYILIALLPQLLFTLVQGQQSPCPQYFRYIIKPGTDEMIGQIEIQSPPKVSKLHLKVGLKLTTELPTVCIFFFISNLWPSMQTVSNNFKHVVDSTMANNYFSKIFLKQNLAWNRNISASTVLKKQVLLDLRMKIHLKMTKM